MKFLVCVLLTVLLAVAAFGADVSGKWSGTYTFEDGNSGAAFMLLKQSGGTISGTAGPGEDQQWAIQNGKVDGNKISFELKSPDDGATYKLELTLAGDTMKGAVTAGAGGGQGVKGKIELARAK
jgi:hypothetical protein